MQQGHMIGFVRSVRLGRGADASKDGAMVRCLGPWLLSFMSTYHMVDGCQSVEDDHG